MQFIHLLTAAALMLVLGACGDLYSSHGGGAYRSLAGYAGDNPAPAGPPASGPAFGPGQHSDVGSNPSQGAPTGGP